MGISEIRFKEAKRPKNISADLVDSKILLRFALTYDGDVRFSSVLMKKSESSSAGRARPCQGRGREFESRLSLSGALAKGLCCLEAKFLPSKQSLENPSMYLWVVEEAGMVE